MVNPNEVNVNENTPNLEATEKTTEIEVKWLYRDEDDERKRKKED